MSWAKIAKSLEYWLSRRLLKNTKMNSRFTASQTLPKVLSAFLYQEEYNSMNKCEEAGLVHAWRNTESVIGFGLETGAECANCGLKRMKHYQSKEWWSYSDGRPDEPIVNIRPV